LSKIFDALNKAQGEVAAFALPLIDNAGTVGVVTEQRAPVQMAPQSLTFGGTLKTELKHLDIEEAQLEGLDRVVYYTDPNSPAADRFRLLQMRLREHWTAGKLSSILVTSPLPGDGKSTVALNLATALTEQRKRTVLLVDADLHRGRLSEWLGLRPHAGLAECLQHGLNPLSAVRRIEPLGWYLLSAGKLREGSPTELLQPQDVSSLLQKLSPHFDWIVIDSPPVLALSDAVALTHHVDGSLLVARAGCTSAKAIEDTIALVGQKNVIGLVLNGMEQIDQPYSAYHNYYREAR
jgi:capsular exopolysaccharide synthesis family protein